MDYMDLAVRCPREAVKFNHSLGHYNDVIMGAIASQIPQPRRCLLNRLFRRRSKRTSKLCFTGLCAGNSSGTGEIPTQMASHAETVSIWWRHHVKGIEAISVMVPNPRFHHTTSMISKMILLKFCMFHLNGYHQLWKKLQMSKLVSKLYLQKDIPYIDFTGTGAVVWSSQFQWSNHVGRCIL